MYDSYLQGTQFIISYVDINTIWQNYRMIKKIKRGHKMSDYVKLDDRLIDSIQVVGRRLWALEKFKGGRITNGCFLVCIVLMELEIYMSGGSCIVCMVFALTDVLAWFGVIRTQGERECNSVDPHLVIYLMITSLGLTRQRTWVRAIIVFLT